MIPVEWPTEFAAAAAMLIKAANLADNLQRSRWDFAVEIGDLQGLGLSKTDLRALVCDGLVEHLADATIGPSTERTFEPTGIFTFNVRSCFVLTETGFSAATRSNANAGHQGAIASMANSCADRMDSHVPQQLLVPKPLWNSDLCRLFWGNLLVKEYRAPAPNQQLVLASFQEEGWPHRIDDPLP